MNIRKGNVQDIIAITALYESIHDYHDTHTNYPGWGRGVYPTQEDAEQGVTEENVFVVYTFAVHPEHRNKRVGKYMLEFILNYASQNDIKAVRLDVYEKNLPAIRLYESAGFEYIDTVDLGYGEYGLEGFRLYQKLI